MGMMKRIMSKLENGQELTPQEEALCDTYRKSPDDPGNEGVPVSIPTTRDIEKYETDRCYAEQGLLEAVSNLLNLGDQPEAILCKVSQMLAEKDPVFAMRFLAKAASDG